MRALVWHGDRRLAIEDAPEPQAGADEAIVEIVLGGICGSDLHGYRGHPGPRRPPLILGHEMVGRLDGRRVVVNPLVPCDDCDACRRGDENCCARWGLLGLDRPGVFAERVAVRTRDVVDVPDGVSDELAALAEPLAVVTAAARLDGIGPGRRVLVIGAGPIGLLAAHVAVQAGAAVEVVEPLPRRRAHAEAMGVDAVHADGADAGREAFDVVTDCVGIEPTWRAALAATRRGGTVGMVGLGKGEGVLPMADLVRRRIRLQGHFAYGRDDFRAAVAMLAAAPPPIGWVEELRLDDGAEAFRRLVDEPADHAKILLRVAG